MYNISFHQDFEDTQMPSIHFCAQHFLLTYAHSEGHDDKPELDPFRIVEVLGRIGAECIVAREHYPTRDGFHLHVFCSFERRFRSRKIDVFDVDGYHPNVEPSRKNALGGYDYATKEGEIVAGGLERPSGVSGRRGTTRNEDVWAEITTAETADEFWRLCEELDPKSMVCNFPALSKFVEWRFRPEPVGYVTPDGVFDLAEYEALSDWRDNVLFGGRAGKQCPPGGWVGQSSPTWAPPRGTHSQVVQRRALVIIMLIADTRQTEIPHLIRTY
uniref:Replication-associated protein n=1 Tax=Red panda feces-associated gemycircularvirus TaxID=2864013 RepID=A0A8K1HKN3_9VIRU|nr:replication-associated protein [Red panda feces-associated gemycircularvirus]